MTIVGIAVACRLALTGSPFGSGGDPWNYLAAGERLNAGHALYALSAGDRPVNLNPPYWTVPLLSPPLIAVIWRPLALLGEPAMVVWWVGGVLAMTLFVGYLIRTLPPVWLLGLVAVSPFLALTTLSGNATVYLVPLLAFRHPGAVALAAGVKLTPVLLAPAAGLRRTAIWGVGLGVASLAFGGWQNHVDWLRTVPQSAPTPASISGITGLPPGLVLIACAALALRGWRWAVVAATFANPVVYYSTLSLLAAALPKSRDARPRSLNGDSPPD